MKIDLLLNVFLNKIKRINNFTMIDFYSNESVKKYFTYCLLSSVYALSKFMLLLYWRIEIATVVCFKMVMHYNRNKNNFVIIPTQYYCSEFLVQLIPIKKFTFRNNTILDKLKLIFFINKNNIAIAMNRFRFIVNIGLINKEFQDINLLLLENCNYQRSLLKSSEVFSLAKLPNIFVKSNIISNSMLSIIKSIKFNNLFGFYNVLNMYYSLCLNQLIGSLTKTMITKFNRLIIAIA